MASCMVSLSRFTSKSMAKQRQKHDGLSSIKFQRLALEFREKYTWILIKANEKKIMAVIIFLIVLIVLCIHALSAVSP